MKHQLKIELSCSINEQQQTHYLIYKMINNVNGKYYIGQHITTNIFDSYSGSGIYLHNAKLKYGLSAFTKIILFDFDNFDNMNIKEQELVPLSACYPNNQMSYNLAEGGYSGQLTESTKNKISKSVSKAISGENNPMYGYQWSDEQRKHQSDVMKGKNSYANMSSTDYELRCKKLSQAKLGNKNPMYGKNCEDFMTLDAIKQKRQRMKDWQQGTKRMQNLSISKKVINVKLDQVDEYLKQGYTFFKFKKSKQ